MACGIVTAAGSGSRLGGDTVKAEVELCGRPLLLYSLQSFESAASIREVVLVLPAGLVGAWPLVRLRDAGLARVSAVIEGGESRQESVYRALSAVSCDTVVVHDGARPLVTPAMIDAVAAVPAGADGLIAAIRATDTVKEVVADKVHRTLDRDALVYVQTPQAFRTEALLEAHRRALADGFVGTDDASLVERIGGTVRVVEGSRDNIKVTYPEDLLMAEALLRARRQA